MKNKNLTSAVRNQASFVIALSLFFVTGAQANSIIKNKMSEMKSAAKNLASTISDGSQIEASLHETKKMADAVLVARGEVPKKADTLGLQGEARAQFISDYQAAMDGLIKKLSEIKAALESTDTALAAQAFSEIPALQKDGHSRFK